MSYVGGRSKAAVPSPRILVVDDDSEVTKEILKYVRFAGYVAEAVNSPAEALRRLQEASFDLVITSLGNPLNDASGFVGETKSRPEAQAVPVIFNSGRSTEGGRGRPSDFAGTSTLEKTIRPIPLLRAVRTALGRRALPIL